MEMEKYYRQKMKEAAMKIAVLVENTPWIEALKDDAAKTTLCDIQDAKEYVHQYGSSKDKSQADIYTDMWMHFYCELMTLMENNTNANK